MTSLLLSRVGVLAQHIGVSAPPVTNMPEADWLLTITAADGAIVETSGGDQNCRPYMANYAAMGLARAFEVTNNTDYLDAAWNWLAWYRDHMDPVTGYVDDYHTVDYLTWTSYGTADSTDAYAGTYLVALWLAYAADQDDTKLALFIDSIPLALTAIESTQQSDGLTYALPTYDVKYLEDNIETLVGCRAAQFLASTSPSVSAAQPDLFSRARATSEALATGIGYMWNHDAGDWDFAIHSNRVFAHNNWADENARRQQIWAVGWNASYSGTADLLLAAYVAAFPDWMTQTASYEPMPTWANAAITGDITDATTVEDTGVAQGRVYPWTCQISGMIIIGLLGFSPNLPYPGVNFPDGSNKIWNNSLADGGDGIAIGISNYGGPAMALYPLDTGGNYQHMDTPDGNGWDSHWDPFPVIENTYVTFSVFQRIDRLGSGGEAVLKYELYDSGGALVTYGYDVKNVLSGPDFTRWYVTAWIPPGAVTLRPIIGMSSGAIDFAYPQLELGGSPTRSWNGVPVAPPIDGPVPTSFSVSLMEALTCSDAVGFVFTGAAPLLLPFSDDFNRADGPVGGWWTSGGTYVIASGTLHDNTGVDGSICNYDTGVTDVEAGLTWVVIPPIYTPGVGNASALGVLARGTPDNQNHYLFHAGSGGNVALYKRVSGTYILLWDGSSSGGPIVKAGDVMALRVIGPNITCRVNEAVVHTQLDTALTTGTFVGLRSGGADSDRNIPRVDNFYANPPLFTDIFQRADGALGSPWANVVSASYGYPPTDVTIASHQAVALGTNPFAVAVVDTGHSDLSLYATFTALPTNAQGMRGIAFRVQDSTHFFVAIQIQSASGELVIYKFNGAAVTIAGRSNVLGSNGPMSVKLAGSSIVATAPAGGSLVTASITDVDFMTATQHGLVFLIPDPAHATSFTAMGTRVTRVPFSDDFHRVDGQLGNGWSGLYATAAISGNKAVSTTEYATYGQDFGKTDVDVTGSFIVGTSGTPSGYVLGRATGPNDNIKFGFQPNQLILMSTVAGSPSVLLTVPGPFPAGTALTLRMVLTGTAISCYRDGVLVGSATVPVGAAHGTIAGFQISEPNIGGAADACTLFSIA